MKNLLRFFLRIAIMLFGFLFIFSLPSLLGIGKHSIQLNFNAFWENVKENYLSLIHVNLDRNLELFKQLHIAESYQYTMTILLVSIVVVIFMAIIFSLIVMLAPLKVRNILKNVINFFEGIPDLLVIFLFMFFYHAL